MFAQGTMREHNLQTRKKLGMQTPRKQAGLPSTHGDQTFKSRSGTVMGYKSAGLRIMKAFLPTTPEQKLYFQCVPPLAPRVLHTSTC